MSVSILEALQNAEYNLKNDAPWTIQIAMEQLHNAIDLLEKGYGPDEQVEPLLEKYGSIDAVPDKEDKE